MSKLSVGGLVARWRGMSRRGAAVTSAVLALVCVLAGLAWHEIAVADDNRPVGRPVDEVTAQTISLAALSCPALSGSRLAAQLMANSGLDPDAANPDGGGIASMPPAVFRSWVPWPQAEARDATAGIYALAHYMCDLVGQIRLTGIAGDRWQAALAAYHSGTAAVKAAAGVPADAKSYVDLVTGYAAWYADLAVFGGTSAPSGPSPSTTEVPNASVPPGRTVSDSPVAVPVLYAAAVRSAGSVCAQITPARVAAQLMASSGFDPNRRSADGAMGIAQFRVELWSRYAPKTSSPWDPAAAISMLGTVMCDLVKTVAPMGGDSYQHALAAFRVGVDMVRAAGGLPPVPAVKEFVSRTTALADFYAVVGSMASTSSTSPSLTASSSPTPAKTTAAPKLSSSPSPSPTGPTRYKFVHVRTGKVMTVPNRSPAAGEILVQQTDTGGTDQQWLLIRDADGMIRIKSAFNGLVLSPLNGSVDLYALVAQVPDASAAATRWRLNDVGEGKYQVQNSNSGLLLALQYMVDTDGTKLFQHPDTGNDDPLWRLIPVR
ncbi:RICIN domain-containing protein [Dactylosporangium sp. CA-233914]|uniref:RICIN domain-containing protein n=1 Tax=Dactylosporangium sp. CA-233914 TaxID=3239934 RepID=UPI003D9297F7